MNAIRLLREMHAETKVRLKVILATEDPTEAHKQWQALRPKLELHEQLEDQFVYTPAANETGPGTPLGDWDVRHEADVAVVQRLIAAVDELDPAAPDWRLAVGKVADALNRHVTDEEGQIFGHIEQAWSAQRLEQVGAEMAKLATRPTPTAARARRR
jgi:hypothetical protein